MPPPMSSARHVLSPAEFAVQALGLMPYDWQLEALEDENGQAWKRMALVAANGSGKTAMVNVVLLLWFLYTNPRGIAMVTSGSWKQIETQLWPNLMMYSGDFTRLGWSFTSKRISTPEGGFIEAYSTIQPGRAEGHHEHLPERPVMLMVDEAKSVPEPIFEAISRCTPTYLILTSSPGTPSGTFYKAHRDPSWKGMYHTVHVSAFDCPHIDPARIARAKVLYGPNYDENPVYRSMILGEFTEGDAASIIPRNLVMAALRDRPAARDGDVYAGVDWAAGGDETVMAVRRGNQLRIVYKSHEKDTVKAAADIVARCRAAGIRDCNVYGDICGIGLAIMQAAHKMHGFRFKGFNGGEPADDGDHYQDRNIEAWYYFRRALEMGEVCFPDGLDDETITQLCDRLLDWNARGKLRCERKEDMRKRGVHSPDRADALVMAWWAGRYMSYAGEPRPDAVFDPGRLERGAIMPRDFAF